MSDEERSIKDELAAMRAQTEQGNEARKEFARALATYFDELLELGFTRREALVLTSSFQLIVLSRPLDDAS